MQLKTVLTSLTIVGALSTQVVFADIASTISGAVDKAKETASAAVDTVKDTASAAVKTVTGSDSEEPAIKPGDYEDFNKFVSDAGIMPPCTTCHKLGTKLVGPSYNAVALYYSDKGEDEELIKALEDKIAAGGSGTWGAIPMPPNPTAKVEDLDTILHWVLSLELTDEEKEAAQAEIDAMPAE